MGIAHLPTSAHARRMKRDDSFVDPEAIGFRKAGALDPDDRGRIALGRLLRRLETGLGGRTVSFHAWLNAAGQLLLDPVVDVPLRKFGPVPPSSSRRTAK